jgi:hypothetical protein
MATDTLGMGRHELLAARPRALPRPVEAPKKLAPQAEGIERANALGVLACLRGSSASSGSAPPERLPVLGDAALPVFLLH